MSRLPFLPALAGLLMAVTALPAAPADVSPGKSGATEYAIEIVVFQYLDPDDGGEIGSSEATLAGFESAPEGDSSPEVMPLDPDQLQLGPEAYTFRRSRNYRLLLHEGWPQPLQERAQARPVHLRYPAADTAPATTQSYGRFFPVDPEPAMLEGTVTVALERYLHLSVDLVFRPDTTEGDLQQRDVYRDPESAVAETAVPPPVFRMIETRRMRSGERHYFDHPRIGVIALITAYEVPADDAPPEKPEQPPQPATDTPAQPDASR